MKVLSKKLFAFCLAVVLAVTALHSPMEVQAASSASKVKKAYENYLKKQIENCNYEDDIEYYFYDFNKDKTNELVVVEPGGARPYYDVYTYRNKKVVCLEKDTNQVGYIKGKKYIVSHGSGGAYDFNYTVYKVKKDKLVQVDKYACVKGIYKKNGKTITKSKFYAFVDTVVFDLGTSQQVPKKYFSPESLGFSVYGSSGGTYTSIEKANNKKVFYYNYKLGEASTTTGKSKLKSAKITSKTKFYYGDLNHLFSGKAIGDSMDTKKWVYQISKKQFIQKMKTYRGACDKITVKNGKVTKVVIHVQVAG